MIWKKKTLIFIISSMILAVQLTSCRNDRIDDVAKDIEKENEVDESAVKAVSPIGLTYHNFLSDNDVEILNADTTEISVSRALAERLGVETFVNHPIGVWQRIDCLPYLRRVISENLVDDRYILKVERTTLGESLGGIDAELQTDFYLNDSYSGSLRRGEDGTVDMESLSSRYRDGNNVIHPAVVLFTDPYGYDKPFNYSDEEPSTNTLRSAAEGYKYLTAEDMTGQGVRWSSSGRLISAYAELEKKFYFVLGDHADSLTLWLTCPLMFELNYKFSISTSWQRKCLFVYTPHLKSLEMGMNGLVDFNPQLTFGYQSKFQPKDFNKTFNICKFKGYTFVFWVGPIPVPISIKPSLDVKLYTLFSTKATTRIEYEFKKKFDFGFKYDENNGWSDYSDSEVEKNSGKFYPCRVDFKAQASAGLFLGADIQVYEVAGPQISIGPQLFLFSKLSLYPTDKKHPYKFKGDLDFGLYLMLMAKLNLFGYNIAEWKSFTCIGPKWNIWHYNSDEKAPEEEDLEMLENDSL